MSTQINAIKEKFTAWLQSLSDSEQKLVKFAGGFFAVFLVVMIINSIQSGVEESNRKLKQQQDLNNWALQQISIVKSSANGTTSRAAGSLTQVINNTSRQYNINIARLQPQKTDLVKVGLEDVGFNRLMQWLADLQSKHGVRVESIDLSKADEEGKVKVRRLDLGRG